MNVLAKGLLDEAAALLRRNDLAAAIARCWSAFALAPNDAEVLRRLGALLGQQGRSQDAIPLLQRSLKLDPSAAEGHNNLGVALRDAGRLEQAVVSYRRALAISPRYTVALNNLGVALVALGQLDEAIARYGDAIAEMPHYAEALNNLGVALHRSGRDADAAERFEAVIAIEPRYAAALVNLGHSHLALGQIDAALRRYRQATSLYPEHPDHHYYEGLALSVAGHTAAAIASLRRACALRPEHAEAQASLAMALLEAGQVGDARERLERAIEIDPSQPRYYCGLITCTTLTEQSGHFAALAELATRISAMGDRDAVQLHYALGKALGDVGRNEEGFRHLVAGASLHRRSIAYDEAREIWSLRRAAALFTADIIERRARRTPADAVRLVPAAHPVFIVGMPRSGSTLVEQILGSHSQVTALGEIDAFDEAARSVAGADDDVPGGRLTDAQIDLIGERYLERVGALSSVPERSDRGWFTDKKLDNIRHVGLIHCALPQARIIHIRRDPVDTCLSCFSLFFKRMNYTYDLGELGRRYAAYAQVMSHWRETLPREVMLEISYEELVTAFDATARRLISHVGLEWEPACKDFHLSERPVRTASVTQVRQPLYRSSLRRWRPDDDAIGPLLEELGPLLQST